jgi:hypothetical protein
MTAYPKVTIGGRFPPNDVEVPANLEVEMDGRWVSLGTLGSTNFGGRGSTETGKRYRELVGRLVRLYLAAPDLLAALEKLTGECLTSYNPHTGEMVVAGRFDITLNQARAAIKKAKGEEP